MIAITTRYHGPTNTRGARIVATAHDGSERRTYSRAYDHAVSAQRNHHAAAVSWVVAHRPEWSIAGEGLGAPGIVVHLAGLLT